MTTSWYRSVYKVHTPKGLLIVADFRSACDAAKEYLQQEADLVIQLSGENTNCFLILDLQGDLRSLCTESKVG